jgi:imidazolonepropionase-like amidohydrolase
MKTHSEILEEFYDSTLRAIVQVETELEFLKTLDSQKVIGMEKKIVAGTPMNQEKKVEDAIREGEESLKEKKKFLDIIEKRLKSAKIE